MFIEKNNMYICSMIPTTYQNACPEKNRLELNKVNMLKVVSWGVRSMGNFFLPILSIFKFCKINTFKLKM